MKLFNGFVVAISIFTSACGAAVQVKTSPTDWRTAYDADHGRCDARRAPSQDAYAACLEEQLATRQEIAARMPAMKSAIAKHELSAPVPSASFPGFSPAPGPVSQPQPQPQVSRNYTFVPNAGGAQCDGNEGIILHASNSATDDSADDWVEVRASGKLAPYPCDAQDKLVLRAVRRHNGTVETVWLVPPHTEDVRFVFLPVNGGLGRVTVYFESYLDIPCAVSANGQSVCLPLPAVGHMERTFNVPRTLGNAQDVTRTYMKKYGQR